MVSTHNLGDNWKIEEDANGDYTVVYKPTSTVIERIDATNQAKAIEKLGTLTDATSGATVYDSSTETLGDGTQSGDLQSVSAGELPSAHGYRGVVPSDSLSDIQSVFDEYDKRDVTVRFKRGQYGAFTSPLNIGQLTKLVGEAALLNDQGTDEYDPRPMLEFSGTTGIQTADGVSYRSQRNILEEITLVGDGTVGTSGVDYRENTNGSSSIAKVGLPVLDHVYIEHFETAVNGRGSVDSLYANDVHVAFAQNGFLDLDSEAKVTNCIFWEMNGGTCVDVGDRSNVRGCEIQPVSSNTRGIVLGGILNTATGNVFKSAYSKAIEVFGAANTITNNTFHGEPNGSVIDLSSGRNAVIGNTFGHSSFTNATRGVLVSGNYNIISGNVFTAGYQNETIKIESGSTETIILGRIPDGVTDNGTRTVINGYGTNSGDPSASGEWNGNASLAYRLGVTVWDTSTSPSTPYIVDDSGNWVAI